ncbi:hypothetical protein [Bradyrhizobium icense]|nr:hypothetical protein [Bradyrhizobium icense]
MRPAGEPCFDLGRLVGGVVIDDDMDIQPFNNLSIDLFLRKVAGNSLESFVTERFMTKATIISSGAISNPIREAFYAAD